MPKLNLKPNHKAIRDYYATLQEYEKHDIQEGTLYNYRPSGDEYPRVYNHQNPRNPCHLGQLTADN